jgi:transcriptional regulator with XRE-family HTH domain
MVKGCENSMNLGGKIKKLREERKLSMRELGERVGVSHAHISKLESGINSPSVDLLQKLADFFDIDITYFFMKQKDLDMFSEIEQELLKERDLSVDSLKEKYNLIIDGKQTTEAEIEKMVEYLRALRIINQKESS